MGKKPTNRHGRDRLEEAMALLIQNQAEFVSSVAETNRRIAENERPSVEMRRETDRQFAEMKRETDERFARIERDMAAIIRTLAEHSRLLERLPEAICDKIGF